MKCDSLAYVPVVWQIDYTWQHRVVGACRPNRDRGEPCGSPLPHHLTCGSASGGSTKRSKVAPQVSEKHKSLSAEPLFRQAEVAAQRFG